MLETYNKGAYLMRYIISALIAIVLSTGVASAACKELRLGATGQQNLARDLGLGFRPLSNQGLPVALCWINHSGAGRGAYQAMYRYETADYVIFYPTRREYERDKAGFDEGTVLFRISRFSASYEKATQQLLKDTTGLRATPQSKGFRYQDTGRWQNVTVTVFYYPNYPSSGVSTAMAVLHARPSADSIAAARGVKTLFGLTKAIPVQSGNEQVLGTMLYRALRSIPLGRADDLLSTVEGN